MGQQLVTVRLSKSALHISEQLGHVQLLCLQAHEVF